MFKIKIMREEIILPLKVYDGDAGFDLFNDNTPHFLKPFNRVVINLGFAMEIRPNWVALIQEKSGMAVNQGIITIGNVIDSTYRGEAHVIILNMGADIVRIQPYQKVAQMLLVPCYTGKNFDLVDDLSCTQRNDKGFGSSGL